MFLLANCSFFRVCLYLTSCIFCNLSEDGGRYKGIGEAVMKIYVNEGILSFWTGFGAYYMRTAPHAMIILMTTQPITDHYKKTFKL